MSEMPPVHDPLGEALHYMRLSGTFYSRCEFRAPWGLELPSLAGTLMFHVVTSGTCWLLVDGTEPRAFREGDLALIPHGEGHQLVSRQGTPAVGLFDIEPASSGDRYEILRLDGGGEPTTLVCGVLRFDHPAARHMVSLLPRVITVGSGSALQGEWLRSTVQVMAHEARELRPGGETVVTRLADVIVIQAIRSWLEQDPAARTGWLGALRDAQVGRAISLMQGDPAGSWTVERLASEVAMSRSAFSARFTRLVGEPPMQYLSRWRMHVAMSLMTDRAASLGEVAARVGYESEAAFSRAFKRLMGVSPGAARRVELSRAG